MVKREAELKAQFTAALRQAEPGFVVLLIANAGGPDRLIAGCGRMTSWEFKHATPGFDSPGLQELICCRLARQGHCRYVVWVEHRGAVGTAIVHPQDVMERKDWNLAYEARCDGHDMTWLVEQVRRAHRC